MPLDDRKIVRILFEECEGVEERCVGYQNLLLDLLSDIIQAERQNLVQATNIQQKISALCSAAGGWLADTRSKEGTSA